MNFFKNKDISIFTKILTVVFAAVVVYTAITIAIDIS